MRTVVAALLVNSVTPATIKHRVRHNNNGDIFSKAPS